MVQIFIFLNIGVNLDFHLNVQQLGIFSITFTDAWSLRCNGKSLKVSTFSQIHYALFKTVYSFTDIATKMWNGWLLQQNYTRI